MESYVIYGLIDPRHDCVRYVGYTKYTAEDRLRVHAKSARRLNTPVANWILKLRSLGVQPEALTLEIVSDWAEAECRWIEYFGLDSLLNVLPGGQAAGDIGDRAKPRTATQLNSALQNLAKAREVKAQMVQSGWSAPAWSRTMDAESRSKMSKAQKGKPKSEAMKAKLRATAASKKVQ